MESEIKMKHIQDRTKTLDLQPALSVPSVSIHPESVGTNHHHINHHHEESNDIMDETESNDNTLSMTNVTHLPENSPGSVAEGIEITGPEEVRVWLMEKVGLPQYFTNLVQNGYDSINMVKEIDNVSELVEIVYGPVGIVKNPYEIVRDRFGGFGPEKKCHEFKRNKCLR